MLTWRHGSMWRQRLDNPPADLRTDEFYIAEYLRGERMFGKVYPEPGWRTAAKALYPERSPRSVNLEYLFRLASRGTMLLSLTSITLVVSAMTGRSAEVGLLSIVGATASVVVLVVCLASSIGTFVSVVVLGGRYAAFFAGVPDALSRRDPACETSSSGPKRHSVGSVQDLLVLFVACAGCYFFSSLASVFFVDATFGGFSGLTDLDPSTIGGAFAGFMDTAYGVLRLSLGFTDLGASTGLSKTIASLVILVLFSLFLFVLGGLFAGIDDVAEDRSPVRSLESQDLLKRLAEIDRQLVEAVKEAHNDGASWRSIGEALGVHASTAKRRFGPLILPGRAKNGDRRTATRGSADPSARNASVEM